MLADDSYMVSAISINDEKAHELNKIPQIPNAESPVMGVQVMRYYLDYRDNIAVDPLTAILSLSEEDKRDSRVEAAVEEVLEDCLHD